MNKKYIINLLKIKETELIGSAIDPSIKYKNDIDLQEHIYHNTKKVDILNFFKGKFDIAMQNSNVFITDFKCGFYGANVPLRWNNEQIQKGYQFIDGKKYTFISQLKKQSIIKMDIIALIDGQFIEFSNNYYFIFNDKYKTKPPINDIYKSLIFDAIKLQQDNNIFKSLKRIYSFFKIAKIDNKETKQFVILFNSQIGNLYKQLSSLKMLQVLYNNTFRIPKMEDINNNLKLIKDELPEKQKYLIDNIQDSKDFNKNIEKVIKQLNNIINHKLNKYINQHSINISPIYYFNKYKFHRPNV
jgi:hypothetical protein